MLLQDYIVELGILNGLVGIIQIIVYKDLTGPCGENDLPVYIVCEFPSIDIAEK